jgi:hypothetical protein
VLEILTSLSLHFDQASVRDHRVYEIKYDLLSQDSMFDTRHRKFKIDKNLENDRYADEILKACNLYIVENKCLKMTEFAPHIFHNIRSKLGYSSKTVAE